VAARGLGPVSPAGVWPGSSVLCEGGSRDHLGQATSSLSEALQSSRRLAPVAPASGRRAARRLRTVPPGRRARGTTREIQQDMRAWSMSPRCRLLLGLVERGDPRCPSGGGTARAERQERIGPRSRQTREMCDSATVPCRLHDRAEGMGKSIGAGLRLISSLRPLIGVSEALSRRRRARLDVRRHR